MRQLFEKSKETAFTETTVKDYVSAQRRKHNTA